jgi:hypothetical protein
MTGAVVGKPVHFVMDRGIHPGEHRPAVITRVTSAEVVDLFVMTSPADAVAPFVVADAEEGAGKKQGHGSFHQPEKEV